MNGDTDRVRFGRNYVAVQPVFGTDEVRITVRFAESPPELTCTLYLGDTDARTIADMITATVHKLDVYRAGGGET